MKTSTFRIVPLSTDAAEAARRGAASGMPDHAVVVADLSESVRLSTMRYRGGTTAYLEVLDGQRSLFSAELTLAQARGNEYQSLVQLYKVLSGGWQQ